jgi:hypothetical protein
VKAHFHGGPWADKVVELPVAFEAMDVEHGRDHHVRYRLSRWEDGMPHYEVDGMPRVKGQERVFPMPADFAGAIGNDGNAISSRAEADAAIAGVATWLHQQSVNHPGADRGEPQVANVARELCYQLLEAAQADGKGGCHLCGS